MKDAAKTNWVLEIGDMDFDEEVVERSMEVPVVVDFWAPWCGPCRMLGPLLEAEAEARQGQFVLAKINIDEHSEVAGYFQVSGIPAYIVRHSTSETRPSTPRSLTVVCRCRCSEA